MIKNYFYALFALSLSFMFSACSSYNGLTSNVNSHQTDVLLSQKNYKIIKYVKGEASANYYFGIGGGSKRGMIAKARENMLQNAGLIGKSRAVINETVELRTKVFLIYNEVRYIASGYVVEFYLQGEAEPAVEESAYIEPDEPAEPTKKDFGISAGINIQLPEDAYGRIINPGMGYHLGLKAEYSKPNTIKNLFWETQLNLTYLNQENSNSDYYDYKENSLSVAVPLLIGYNFPIVDDFSLYLKGGISPGITYSMVQNYGKEEYPSGFIHTSGLVAMAGLRITQKFQAGLGYRWTGGSYSEYNSMNISLSYMF